MEEPLSRDWVPHHVRGAAALNAIISASVAGMTMVSTQTVALANEPRPAPAIAVAPPVPPALLLRDIAPREALEVNRRIPFSTQPNPSAAPFKMWSDRASFERAVECLATAIYYEAGAEPLDGQRAVAQVVLNRVRHPAFVPTVCGVVYQGSTQITGCQFSFTCDGSLNRRPDYPGWRKARAIAVAALHGAVFAPVGYATHYHADYVVPYWANSIAKNAVVGRHIFYRWPQWWGTPAAFTVKYAGAEADPRLLRTTALLSERDSLAVEPVVPALLPIVNERTEQLLTIIQMLAWAPPSNAPSSAYEQAVRQHFAAFSNHVAVQIYRQLSAEKGFDPIELAGSLGDVSAEPAATPAKQPGDPSRLDGFSAALADFAKHSGFDAFANAPTQVAAGTVQVAGCKDCGPQTSVR